MQSNRQVNKAELASNWHGSYWQCSHNVIILIFPVIIFFYSLYSLSASSYLVSLELLILMVDWKVDSLIDML